MGATESTPKECSGIVNSNDKCVTGYYSDSDTTQPGSGVMFVYTEPDYKGCKATRWVESGQTTAESSSAIASDNCLSDGGNFVMLENDSSSGTGGGISSIKLGPDIIVDLFQWRNYDGDTIRLKSSSPNLANQGFNNKAWSWRITKCPNGTFNSRGKCVTGSSSTSDTTEPGPGCFTVYTESDYKGCKATRCAYHDQGCTDNNSNIPAERIGRCTRAIVSDNCVSNGGAYVMLEDDDSSGTGSGISSVKLGSGTILDVFQWRFYEGDNTTLTSSSSNLENQNWNDKIWSWKATLDCNNNSLKDNILCNSKTYYNTKSPPTTSDSFEPPAGCFTLYTGTNYTGCKATRCAYDNDCRLGVGKCGVMPCSDCSFSDSCEGMSDKVKSIKVSPGINVTLYNNNNLSGNRVDYSTNTSDLGNFKDTASSWMATMDCQHINLKNLSQCFNQDLIIKNLTDLEQNLLRTHLQNHWNNSPFTIFSNRKGHVFKASWRDLDKDLYNRNLNPPLDRTNRFQILKQDTCGAIDKSLCPFRGWRYSKEPEIQRYERDKEGRSVPVYKDWWGDALQLNLNHVDGYNNILNNISPVLDGDFAQTNYCNSDHRENFEENKITIKLPKQLLGGSDENSNFIPGYYLLSYTNGRNNDNTFNFLICNRGHNSIDPAFLLYHKLPFDDYYISMLTYHKVLIKTIIISKIYPHTRNCIINNSMVENQETKKCFIDSSTNMKDLVSRYYTQNYSGCNTVTDFTPFTRCSELVNINNTVLENYQSWLNTTNNQLNDDGIDLLSQYEYVNAKNFYLLNRRLCSTNNKILENTNKNSCGYQLGPENPNQIRPPSERSLYEELYRKELYNSLAKSKCDALTTNKPNICTTINESLTIDNGIYSKINNIWTNKNCYGDIPKSIYTYLIEENPTLTIENNSIDIHSTTSINNFIDELKTSNDIFARKLCYSGDVLENGEVMYSTNSTLYSNSGDILLTLETNGNLVLKRKSDNTILWQTNTSNSIGLSILSMQNDNNLVLYPGWNSNTPNSNSKKAFLVVQDNGKLVLRYSDGTILQTINSSSMENNSISMENNSSSMENNFSSMENNSSSMSNYFLILLLFIIFIILCYIFKSQIYKLWKLNG